MWNSYRRVGHPLAFNWQSATFSVPTLISYLVPVRLAFTVQVLVTLVTAGTGAYVLARILKMDVLGCALAGTVFELSGAFVFWLGWPIGSVLSWSGWLFAAVLLIMRGRSRWRNIVFFAVALTCAVYAGQPDALTLLLLAVLIFAASSLILRWPLLGGSGPILRPFVDLVVAGLAGSALAAPLILPGYQVASTRSRTFQGSTFKRQVAWPVGDIGHLMFQGLNGVPTDFSPLYLGAIVVVLAITGLWWRRRQPAVRALVIVGLVMGIIAFVQPVENVLHQIPGLQAVRWYRSVVLMVLSVSVLAGLGTDALVRSFRVRWVRRLLAIGFAVAAGLLVIVWASGSRKLSLADAWTRTVGFRWSIFEVLIGLLGVGALFVVGKRTKPGDVTADGVARIVGAAFLVCATVFLVATGAPLWHSTSSYATPTPAEKTLQSAVGSSLVGLGAKKCFLPPGIGIHPNANILFGVHELAVYDPMLPRAYFKSWTEVTGQKLDSAGYPLVVFVLLSGGDHHGGDCACSRGRLRARAPQRSGTHRFSIREEDRKRAPLPHPWRSPRHADPALARSTTRRARNRHDPSGQPSGSGVVETGHQRIDHPRASAATDRRARLACNHRWQAARSHQFCRCDDRGDDSAGRHLIQLGAPAGYLHRRYRIGRGCGRRAGARTGADRTAKEACQAS